MHNKSTYENHYNIEVKEIIQKSNHVMKHDK